MCKLTKSEIFAKAKDRVQKQEENAIHIEMCVKAGICPECGENLKFRNITRFNTQVHCKPCNFSKII